MAAKKKTEQTDCFCVSIRRSVLDDRGLENLRLIVKAKESIIRAALKSDSLDIETTDEKISFPWFTLSRPEDVEAYSIFVEKLCALAKTLKRVNAKDNRNVENKKYAFRCFLLRLGLIGGQYKAARKVLLKNLEGSSAFRSSAEKESGDASEKRDD